MLLLQNMFDGMHDGWMWGMHWLWWAAWIVLILGIVWAVARASRDSGRTSQPEPQQESALDILKRRYAEGKLSTEEYEERKEHLERE